MSKMNLPNKLTIFRVILIVPFIILLLGGQAGWFGDNTFVTDMIALAIFIIASLTDLIDGKIARKRQKSDPQKFRKSSWIRWR